MKPEIIFKSEPEWDIEFHPKKKGCPAYFRGFHYLSLFNYQIHVVLAPTVHAAKEIGVRKGMDMERFDEMRDADACCFHNAGGVIILWFRPNNDRSAHILTHEVYHACRYIAEYRKLPMGIDWQEPMAYLNGHINAIVCNMLYEMEQYAAKSRRK